MDLPVYRSWLPCHCIGRTIPEELAEVTIPAATALKLHWRPLIPAVAPADGQPGCFEGSGRDCTDHTVS